MWAEESVFYQIYPLGFTGAPFENDGVLEHRILKVIDWIEHFKRIGINAIYFGPVFQSDTHGYNTKDYFNLDCRLGTNDDFKLVCQKLHENGIRVIVDGVFNHVGRGFWAFQDVLKYRENSWYKDWFNISFDGNSNYNDGLWYEGWEGNYDLVKLNLYNEEVCKHLSEAIKSWIEQFDIDGIRLDVAYCLTPDFLKYLRWYTSGLKEDFFLVGETLHGDYNRWMIDEMCHSVTNYECYKGLYSALNSLNLFEICHSLARQFGPEYWTLYKGKHLFNFLDNHDVNRIASMLKNENHLKAAYGLLFAMPGIPCIYYGSEWGVKGEKNYNDTALRPCFEAAQFNELTEYIANLTEIKRKCVALNYGDYRHPVLTNRQCVIERSCGDDRIFVVVNADSNPARLYFDGHTNHFINLLDGRDIEFDGSIEIEGYDIMYLRG